MSTRDTIGGFRLLGALGRGGMGVVYRARDERAGRDVALKLLVAQSASPQQEQAAHARLAREVEAMARVDHPNVVRVHATGVANGAPYLVLELVTGGSLEDRIARAGALPWREACVLAAGIARGIAAIHAAGIVHRDLKPANVLIDEEGRPKVADFGLSKLEGARSLTETGAILGTPAYLSPEQANGTAAVPASDLYALGCVLHALVAGRPPFAGSPLALIQKHLTAKAPSLAATGAPDAPPALERLVASLLAKRPEDRPDAASVASALEALAVSRPGSGRRSAQRAVAVLVVGAALVAALAAFASRKRAAAPPSDVPVALVASKAAPPPPRDPSSLRAPRIALPDLETTPGPPSSVPNVVALGFRGADVIAVRRHGGVFVIAPDGAGGDAPVLRLCPDAAHPPLTKASLSPDGALVAVCREPKPFVRVEVYDLGREQGPPRTVELTSGLIEQLAVASSGRVFVACDGLDATRRRFVASALAPAPGTAGPIAPPPPRDERVARPSARALTVVPPERVAVGHGVLSSFGAEGGEEGTDVLHRLGSAPVCVAAGGGRIFALWGPPGAGNESTEHWAITACADDLAAAERPVSLQPVAVAASPRGDFVVAALRRSGSEDVELHRFEVRVRGEALALAAGVTLFPLRESLAISREVVAIAISPDGGEVAAGTRAGGVFVVPTRR